MRSCHGQITLVSASLTVLLMLTPASAADTPGRYTMTPNGDGFLRLDTATGAVSQCKADNDQWACKAVADDAQALADEIDRLAKENQTLKSDLEALRKGSGDGRRPAADAAPSLPSDADIDRTIGFIEKLIRKFKGLAEDLRKDEPAGTPL